MVITQPTVDDFSDTTVMRVIRKIVDYICSDSGLVAQINNNDITGFTSSYTNNVLKIDATKGDGTTIPVCNLTIEGGSSSGNPYPTGISGTVRADGNITLTVTMSSGSPLTTTINMNYFASANDLSNLQEQVTGIKPKVTVNQNVNPPTITIAVNGTTSTANLPSSSGDGFWEEVNINNLPTDFVDGDYLIVTCTLLVSSTISSWTDSPSAHSMNVSNGDGVTFITRVGIGGSTQIISMEKAGVSGINGIKLFYLTYVGNASAWNAGTGTLFTFESIVFNADSAASDTASVTRNNISTSINKIIRMRI